MFALRASTNGRAALLQVAAENNTLDQKQAQSMLSQAAAMNPHLDEIWGESGVAEARLGMDSEAAVSLEKARQAQPQAISTLELESMVDATRGNWPDAEAQMVDLSHRSRTEWERFLAAWPHKLVPDANDTSSAARCVREGEVTCVPAIEHQSVTEILSADRLYAQGRWELLIALGPPAENDATNWFRRGIGFAKLGHCLEAIPALERGLAVGIENAAARLAACYESEAEHGADRLKAEGKEGAVHKIRGDILLSIRLDPSQAVNEYNQALRLKPNDPEILEKLAEAYFSLGEMDRARQSAETALGENPQRAQVLRLLARIALSERNYSVALGFLDKLAALEPDDPWARTQQGIAYAQTGHPQEAVDRLKPTLDAGYVDEKGALHAMLASQLRKLGRDEEAKRAGEEAVRLADSYQQQPGSKTEDRR
jgi:tetratricopeptide (TPR) repeat protein